MATSRWAFDMGNYQADPQLQVAMPDNTPEKDWPAYGQTLWDQVVIQGKWGVDFFKFMMSPASIDDQHIWEPVRPLGQGGQGKVGLWARKDGHGNVVQEMAVKQQRALDIDALEGTDYAIEAAVMKQVDKLNCQNIVKLYNFKSYPNHGVWRFYYEYCRNADFDRLCRRYRQWGVYMPEEHLWHIIHGLARAVKAMDDGPFHDLETGELTDQVVIYYDMKPANIFLGDLGSKPFDSYPEQRQPSSQQVPFELWNPPPFGFWNDDGDFEQDSHTSKLNVWGIGITMLQLILLTPIHETQLHRNLDLLTPEQALANGGHCIPEIWTRRHPDYSPLLRDVVRDCLNVVPASHPSPDELMQRAEQGLAEAKVFVDSNQGGQETRSYHQEGSMHPQALPGGFHNQYWLDRQIFMDAQFRFFVDSIAAQGFSVAEAYSQWVTAAAQGQV